MTGKIDRPVAAKPTLILLIIVSLAGGLVGLATPVVMNYLVTEIPSQQVSQWWVYLAVAVGVAQLVVGILLIKQKRIGLQLGLVTYVVTSLLKLSNLSSGRFSLVLGLLLNVVIIYYLYRYLTHEPDKYYFS